MASKTKSFLSRLSKPGKEFVERASSDHRELSFDDFIAKRWKEAITDADWAHPSFVRLVQSLSDRFPKLTREQIGQMLRLHRFADGLDEAAAARRAVREDPAELVLGLRMKHRTDFALRGCWKNDCDIAHLLSMCACGDIELARKVAKGRRGACSAIPNPAELMDIATVAWLNEDQDTKDIVVEEIESTSMKYVQPWEQAILKAFSAAHQADSSAVAARIKDLLDRIKKLKDKTEVSHVINLRAHGLYQLFQACSPKLVAAFDSSQGYPWDPQVHAWCDEHPAFSEGWNFKPLSKDLHEIVALGKVPGWLPKHPGFYQVELLEAVAGNEQLTQAIDGKLSYSEHDPKTIVNACPLIFLYEYDQEIADVTCKRLIAAGGKAKVTKGKDQPYRRIRSAAKSK